MPKYTISWTASTLVKRYEEIEADCREEALKKASPAGYWWLNADYNCEPMLYKEDSITSQPEIISVKED